MAAQAGAACLCGSPEGRPPGPGRRRLCPGPSADRSRPDGRPSLQLAGVGWRCGDLRLRPARPHALRDARGDLGLDPDRATHGDRDPWGRGPAASRRTGRCRDDPDPVPPLSPPDRGWRPCGRARDAPPGRHEPAGTAFWHASRGCSGPLGGNGLRERCLDPGDGVGPPDGAAGASGRRTLCRPGIA